jgi:hypothetical protein
MLKTSKSPGPAKYYCDTIGRRVKLSNSKNPSEFTMPKNNRGLLDSRKKDDGPNPQSYANTNEITNKLILRNIGNVGLPKQERKVDFVKYSTIHKELVEKGLY